jgi:N6-L-threonylcarbamoyladenine synthase
VGSLLVGINYAKALSYAWNLPLVAVHHLEGHLYSVLLELARQEATAGTSSTDWSTLFPAVALVVSGGHTSLYLLNGLVKPADGSPRYQLIGRTRDDAAGEAFDKVAKLLRLGYPGGPVIDRLAPRGDPSRVELPVTRISESRFDFSFSGIKTAVLRHVEKHLEKELEQVRQQSQEDQFQDSLPQPVYDLVASFQQNVVNALVQTTLRAVQWYHPKSLFLAGGVASNSQLRRRFREEFEKRHLPVYFPSPILSTDNAAMIAAAGYPKLLAKEFAGFTLNADVHLQLA